MTIPVYIQEHIRVRVESGVSIRQVARDTGLSRNTVAKYAYQVDYSPQPRRGVSRSMVDAFSAIVVSWLLDERVRRSSSGTQRNGCMTGWWRSMGLRVRIHRCSVG